MMMMRGFDATLLLLWFVAVVFFLLAIMRDAVGTAFLMLMLSSIAFAFIFVLLFFRR